MALALGRPVRARVRRVARSADWRRSLVLLVLCALSAFTVGPYRPPTAPSEPPTFELGPAQLARAANAGVALSPGGEALRLGLDALAHEGSAHPSFGVAESDPIDLAGPSRL